MSYDKPFRFAAFLIARYILSTIFLQHSINITFRFIGQTFYGCYCNWFDESYNCWAQRQVVALWHSRILSPAVFCSVLAYVWSVGIETHIVEKCVHKYMIMMYCANDIATSEFRICRNNRNRKIIICIIDGWMLFTYISKSCPEKDKGEFQRKFKSWIVHTSRSTKIPTCSRLVSVVGEAGIRDTYTSNNWRYYASSRV